MCVIAVIFDISMSVRKEEKVESKGIETKTAIEFVQHEWEVCSRISCYSLFFSVFVLCFVCA